MQQTGWKKHASSPRSISNTDSAPTRLVLRAATKTLLRFCGEKKLSPNPKVKLVKLIIKFKEHREIRDQSNPIWRAAMLHLMKI